MKRKHLFAFLAALPFCVLAARPAAAYDSVVVFNEVHYAPAAGQTEFVELRNLHGVDVNLGGWSITSGIDFTFPLDTVIPGHGYLVVAADPTKIPGALGPFSGSLNNAGETIRLRNQSRRIMDELTYAPDGPWPAAADALGATLARKVADASEGPEAWTHSAQPGGTPGAPNFPDSGPPAPTLVFNETAAGGDAAFFVELRNVSGDAVNTAGWSLVASSGQTVPLPPQTVPAGGLLTVDSSALGFTPAAGDRLGLFFNGGSGVEIRDARLIGDRGEARTAEGEWAFPAAATPGAKNTFAFNEAIVINEIFYHAPDDSPEQWLELHNRSNATVDLGGWSFTAGITYTFPAGTALAPGGYLVLAWDPAAFAALHPGVTALGPFSGRLSGKGELLTLRDAAGNVADQVRYADGGRWSPWADGGGSSLELIDPRADNGVAEAWEASDESLKTQWQTITYSGRATHSPTSSLAIWQEFVMGLLDAGEVLVDDIKVTETLSGGTTRELIQNGTFDGGTAEFWRNIGTHRKSEVVDDPLSPGNKALKIVATAATEHMHNHCETTLKAGSTFLTSTSTTNNFTISLRAKWLRGSNRLHTRLYFNRLARQTVLERPATGGTPGAPNSRRVANAGPTFKDLAVLPVVPAADEPATVRVKISDPDGVASAELFTSVNGAAFTSTPMTATGDGEYSALIPGQPQRTVVQFYVKATDGAGAVSHFPAAGPESRAMIPWADGRTLLTLSSGAKPHNIRIVFPTADANEMYLPENVMSNEYRPCTVIVDDTRAYYHASVRLKSSEHGRFQENRVGFNLKFGSDELFMGAHATVSIDRSGNDGNGGIDGSTLKSAREVLLKTVMNAAGGIYSVEDDLIRLIAPVATSSAAAFRGNTLTGPAIFSKSRFDDEYLDGQWENGGDGPMFKQEYVYPMSQTINPVTRVVGTNREFPKIPQTGGDPGPSGIAVQGYGANKEDYRWHWLIRNARSRDDYSGLIAAVTTLGKTGTAFRTEVRELVDVDTWLRAAVVPQLFGVVDNFLGDGSTHNFILYFPPGGKATAIPWDMDYLGQSNPSAGITNGGLVSKFITDPEFKRAYYGHVLDILERSFNDAFLTRWAQHYAKFTNYTGSGGNPGNSDNIAASLPYLRNRANYVNNLVRGIGRTPPVPVVEFTLTSPAEVTTAEPTVTVTGTGWIDVAEIRLQSSGRPLEVTWPTQNTWSLQLPAPAGTQTHVLMAINRRGETIGAVTVKVTGAGALVPASADNIVVSELHYHPSDPTPAEIAAGFTIDDDFEFIELQNISDTPVDLSGCYFETGITFTFPAGTHVPAGGRLVLPRRKAAFETRHPGVATVGEYYVATDPTGNQFSNGGEEIALMSATGQVIKRFFYDDVPPWPVEADGAGRSLVLIAPRANPDHSNPLNWRASAANGGNPGGTDAATFTGDPNADTNGNGVADLVEFALGTSAPRVEGNFPGGFTLSFERNPLAAAGLVIEKATALSGPWEPLNDLTLTNREAAGNELERLVFSLPGPDASGRCFFRVRVTTP